MRGEKTPITHLVAEMTTAKFITAQKMTAAAKIIKIMRLMLLLLSSKAFHLPKKIYKHSYTVLL